jgi:hypothetical protein
MAIQISGCTVIDNSRNITNANNMCVGVVTMTGSSGDIETPGTISAGAIDFPLSVVSFSPADGATDVNVDSNIVITFNQFVEKPTTGIGTTANITLRNSSGIGTVLQTIGINSTSTSVTINGAVVTIKPPSGLPETTNVFVVVDAGAFVNNFGGNSSLIDTYNFTTVALNLGDAYEGGFLICKSSPTRWVVASNTSEVSRTWNSRDDANTRAQQVSGCTGWFVPTSGQLQNPGYTCRDFWDSFVATDYWSNTPAPSLFCSTTVCTFPHVPSFGTTYTTTYYRAESVSIPTGNICTTCTDSCRCIRAFRCVTY